MFLDNPNIEVPGVSSLSTSAFQNTRLTSNNGLGTGSLKPPKNPPSPEHKPNSSPTKMRLTRKLDFLALAGGHAVILSVPEMVHDFSPAHAKLLQT